MSGDGEGQKQRQGDGSVPEDFSSCDCSKLGYILIFRKDLEGGALPDKAAWENGCNLQLC